MYPINRSLSWNNGIPIGGLNPLTSPKLLKFVHTSQGNLESFSEAELESLEFVPEELEAIEAERVPDLDSISFEEVAKDLETYFEGNIEETVLEGRGRRSKPRRSKPRRPQGQQQSGRPRPRPGNPSPAEREQIRQIKADITLGNLGGRVYNNAGGHGSTRLPSLSRKEQYREYDLGGANDGSRGKHRLVVLIGSNRRPKKMYYTNDHYTFFTQV